MVLLITKLLKSEDDFFMMHFPLSTLEFSVLARASGLAVLQNSPQSFGTELISLCRTYHTLCSVVGLLISTNLNDLARLTLTLLAVEITV